MITRNLLPRRAYLGEQVASTPGLELLAPGALKSAASVTMVDGLPGPVLDANEMTRLSVLVAEQGIRGPSTTQCAGRTANKR